MGKITTADIKNGVTFYLDGNIYTITEFLHVKPGKGGAFVRTKIKGVVNGKIIDKTFRSGESLETVRVERHPYQFLYADDEFFHVMHQETYDQIMLSRNSVDRSEFMKEGEIITVVMNADEGKVLFAEIPDHVILQVSQTEPGIKGDTATNATKPATLESGASIQVPLFINEGDSIKVDTQSGNYIERVKV